MWMLLLWLSCVADADVLFCRLAKFIYFSFRLWSKICLSGGTWKFTTWLHLCGVFTWFNGRILATPTSTWWAKNRSFSAVYRGVMQQ